MTSGLLCLQETRTEEREKDLQTVETDEIKETDIDRGVRAAVLLLMTAVVARTAGGGQDHLRGGDHLGATREDAVKVVHLPAIESVTLIHEIEIETLVEKDHFLEARVAEFQKNASQSQLIIQKILTCAL